MPHSLHERAKFSSHSKKAKFTVSSRLSVVFQRTKSLIWNIWIVRITKVTAETSITEIRGGGRSKVRIEWEKQQTSKNVDQIADDKLTKTTEPNPRGLPESKRGQIHNQEPSRQETDDTENSTKNW
jgi:hypothetical protein